MLALQPEHPPGLALEPQAEGRAFAELLSHELDGHELAETEVSRRHDRPHPTEPERPLDPVFVHDQLAALHGHRLRFIAHNTPPTLCRSAISTRSAAPPVFLRVRALLRWLQTFGEIRFSGE